MTNERISIEITDSVDSGIQKKIKGIATDARTAHTAITKLDTALKALKSTALDRVSQAQTRATRELDRAAIASQRLATERNRTAQAEARLATATAQTAAAQARAEQAAMRLEAAQSRAAAATQRSAQASDRAAAAAAAQTRNLAAQEVEVARIAGIHDRFNAVLARTPRAQQAMANGHTTAARAAALNRHELTNLSYQIQDVIVSLGSGQRPMQVLLQQGSQIGQIFGASGAGMGAIFRQLAILVGRFVVALAPLALILAPIATAFGLFVRDINKGIKGDELVKELNLTEKQLERLKKSGESLTVTWGDTFKAFFQVTGQRLNAFLKQFGLDFGTIKSVASKMLDDLTKYFNFFIRTTVGNWLGAFNAIKVIWKNLPQALGFFAIEAGNNMIRAINAALNAIGGMLANSPLGKLLNLDAKKLQLPTMDNPYKEIGADIGAAFKEGHKTANKFITDFGKDVAAQARENAKKRIKEAAGDPDKKKDGSGFNKARELAAINAELDSQARNMFKLADARDAFNRADEIALRFAKEKQPLTEAEITALRNKIQALNDAKQVQQEFDRIYQAATGPAKTYNATLEAADKLLKMGAISQAQYTAELLRAKEANLAATNAFHSINKDLDDQIKLLKMLPLEREVEAQVMQAVNQAIAEGKPVREQEIEDLRKKLQLVQSLNTASAIQAQMITNSSANQLAGTDAQIKAIQDLRNNPAANFSSGDAAGETNNILKQMGIDTVGMGVESAAFVAQFDTMYQQIDALRQANLLSEQDAGLARQRIWQMQFENTLNQASTFFGALSTLQKSENKKMARIGKAAAIAQALINTYQSATAAYNAMAGIPYVGPALGVAAAAAAVAAGLNNVAQIRSQEPGFKAGGYTGDFDVNKEVGSVHGREFVMDANTTARIGKENLEALRSGAAQVKRNGDKAGQGAPNSGNVGKAAAAPAPVVNVPITAVVVQSREAAMSAMRSAEGKAFIMETVEENGSTVVNIVKGNS